MSVKIGSAARIQMLGHWGSARSAKPSESSDYFFCFWSTCFIWNVHSLLTQTKQEQLLSLPWISPPRSLHVGTVWEEFVVQPILGCGLACGNIYHSWSRKQSSCSDRQFITNILTFAHHWGGAIGVDNETMKVWRVGYGEKFSIFKPRLHFWSLIRWRRWNKRLSRL